jgi:tubulin alpha
MSDAFGGISHKLDLMYSRRVFVHWYIRDGAELGEFREAREDMAGCSWA